MEAFVARPVDEKWPIMGSILGMYCSPEVRDPRELRLRSDHQLLFDLDLLRWAFEAAGFASVNDLTGTVEDRHTRPWSGLVRALLAHRRGPQAWVAFASVPAGVSAVLAAYNEEVMIEGALRSLRFCDEIVVVVDDRCTDRTEEIARRHADKVLVEPFEDFAQIRNAGIRAATGAWILHVDADERVTPALAAEIGEALAGDTPYLAFESPTINFFWGRRMDHGGWSPMFQPRLVRRDHAFYGGRVHEKTGVPRARIGTLRGERWHFSHRSIEENLLKAIRYGKLDARDQLDAGARRVTAWTFLRVLALEFGRRMIRRAGFRDGMPGTIEGLFQPFALFCAQVMLWELQQGDAIQRRYEALERELEEQR